MAKQVRTVSVTVEKIMRDPEFRRGVDAARRGLPFDWRVDSWNYERGRLFAHIAPLDMPLHLGGRLNPGAVALCYAAFARKLVI